MTPPAAPARDKHQRCPGALLRHGVGLSYRFDLRDRAGEDMLWARGLLVTSEAIHQWGCTCGPAYAHQLQGQRPRPGDPGPRAAGGLPSNGQRQDRWRAGAQDAHVLDLLGQRWRHTPAAPPGWRPVRPGVPDGPRVVMTDQRQRDGAAQRARRPGGAPRPRRSLHKRGAHAPRPTRQRV
jgi:transposase-like protein